MSSRYTFRPNIKVPDSYDPFNSHHVLLWDIWRGKCPGTPIYHKEEEKAERIVAERKLVAYGLEEQKLERLEKRAETLEAAVQTTPETSCCKFCKSALTVSEYWILCLECYRTAVNLN